MTDLPAEKVSTEYDGFTRRLFFTRCLTCAAPKYVPNHILPRFKYCSRACRPPRVQVSLQCSFCLKPFERVKRFAEAPTKSGLRFCGRECKDEAQRLDGLVELRPAHYGTSRDARTIEKHNKELRTCLQCGQPTRREFCSRACRPKRRAEKQLQAWLQGGISGNRGSGRSLTLLAVVRRFMLQKYENRCGQCGWAERNPTTGKIPLAVDHIDGNSSNTVEANLIVLCPNCHALTPTYCGLNRGKGRGSRKEEING